MKFVYKYPFLFLLIFLSGCTAKIRFNNSKEIREVRVKTEYSPTISPSLKSNFDSSFIKEARKYNSKERIIKWVPVPSDSLADISFKIENVRLSSDTKRIVLLCLSSAMVIASAGAISPVALVLLPKNTTQIQLNYNPQIIHAPVRFRKFYPLSNTIGYFTSLKKQEKVQAKFYSNYVRQSLQKMEYEYMRANDKDPEIRQILKGKTQIHHYLGFRLGVGSSTTSKPLAERAGYIQSDLAFTTFGMKYIRYFYPHLLSSLELNISGDRGSLYTRTITSATGKSIEQSYRMHTAHLEVPVTVGYSFLKKRFKPIVYGGLNPAVIFSANTNYNSDDLKTQKNINEIDKYRSFLLEGIIGAGFNYHFRRSMFFVDFRFSEGLTPIYKDQTARSSNIQYFGCGFMFGLD
ncbi:MAG: PorT family protein [Opitutaceae bacterium]|nr:PorT family protein [Cytophagales bacterium]